MVPTPRGDDGRGDPLRSVSGWPVYRLGTYAPGILPPAHMIGFRGRRDERNDPPARGALAHFPTRIVEQTTADTPNKEDLLAAPWRSPDQAAHPARGHPRRYVLANFSCQPEAALSARLNAAGFGT